MNASIDVADLVDKLRQSTKDLTCPEDPEFLKADETYIRFLKSRDWSVEAADKMLRKSVAWRIEFRPHAIQCTVCGTNPGAHTLRQVGFDEAGRPVIFATFYPSSPAQRNFTHEAITHLIFVIENAVRSMAPGVTQVVFIIDCSGMTPQTCHPRIGYDSAQLMSNHYPERLGLAICIRPGPVFKVAWQAIKPFLPPATVSKVTMVTNKTQLQSILNQHFSPSMADWIFDEYKLNRAKPIRSRYRLFYCPAVDLRSEHDPRGESSYVQNWIERKHPSGHQPHPNMTDYLAGKIRIPMGVKLIPANDRNGTGGIDGGDAFEDEDEIEDELAAQKLMASLPQEFQIPADAQQFG